MRQQSALQRFDWLTVLLYLALVLVGWAMIYASSISVAPEAEGVASIFDLSQNYGKQFLWIAVSITIGAAAMLLETRFYQTFAYIFYGVSILALIGVLFTAPINGASSWFNIGGFRLQPSEFAKTATCLTLATYLTQHDGLALKLNVRIRALGILLFPMLLILLQSDAGSALIFLSFFILLFRAGFPAWLYIIVFLAGGLTISSLLFDEPWWILLTLFWLGIGILLQQMKMSAWFFLAYAVLFFLAFFFFDPMMPALILSISGALLVVLLGLTFRQRWQLAMVIGGGIIIAGGYVSSINHIFYQVLKPYQQERILVWLRPEMCDPQGALYNIEQSKFAIGSGGLTGKGFLEGERTKLNYVPEQSTDFIFCTVGEEQGFIGTAFVILLFAMLLLRLLYLAERQRSNFARLYAYGVAGILFFHLVINVGMTMNLVPVIGIPLPFISYGGSSLISFSLMLAILLKLDASRLETFR